MNDDKKSYIIGIISGLVSATFFLIFRNWFTYLSDANFLKGIGFSILILSVLAIIYNLGMFLIEKNKIDKAINFKNFLISIAASFIILVLLAIMGF